MFLETWIIFGSGAYPLGQTVPHAGTLALEARRARPSAP
jgi:hypothetical protein